jgi:CRISPR-associated protein Csm2
MKHNWTNLEKESDPNIEGFKSRFNKLWITDGINSESISYADQLGSELAKSKNYRMTTSQIRNFFGEVKRIQMGKISKNKASFLLLKPKLAYAAKKADKKGVTLFKEIINEAINAVEIDKNVGVENRFRNFCDFLEAILAYHKAAGGKEN